MDSSRAGNPYSVDADHPESVTVQEQPQMTGAGSVDQPPPLDLHGWDRHRWLADAIDSRASPSSARMFCITRRVIFVEERFTWKVLLSSTERAA